MTQAYDPLKPISGTTTFGGLYQIIRDHFAAAISRFSGTSFPAGPVQGQMCFRTDRGTYGYAYVYSGNVSVGESGWIEDATLTIVGLKDAAIEHMLESFPQAVYQATIPPISVELIPQEMQGKNILNVVVPRGMRNIFCVKSEGKPKGVYRNVGQYSNHTVGHVCA